MSVMISERKSTMVISHSDRYGEHPPTMVVYPDYMMKIMGMMGKCLNIDGDISESM